jgi:predicted cobalt transporter CbtA
MSAYWFKQKTHGYGAGLPTAWQGWALIVAYLCAIGAVVTVFQREILWGMAGIVVVTIPFLVLCRAKTEGGWRWRWGSGA